MPTSATVKKYELNEWWIIYFKNLPTLKTIKNEIFLSH